MNTYRQYLRPQTLEEAYTLYQKKRNVIIAGNLWTKMQHKSCDTAIDLCDLGLNTIEETEDSFLIGAMTSLRCLETHEKLNLLTGNALRDCLKQIVGVQFRNCATIGGSLYGRFGFSDPATLFLTMNASVLLYHRGEVSLEEFIRSSRKERDILTAVRVPKTPGKLVYLSQRNQSTDFPVLTCAAVKTEEGFRISIGARPQIAEVRHFCLADREIIADQVAEELEFGSNLRASAAYRRQICKVLVRRALERL